MPKFIRSTIDKYLECLQSGGFWVVLLWIFLYIFFIVRVHTFLTGTYLGVELTECGICLWWNLVYDVNVYENGCTNLHHYVQINSRIYRRGHIAPPLTILKHFRLNSLALLVSVMWQSPIMGYISLMTNEVEHLFTHLVAIWVSVLEVPVQMSCPFCYWVSNFSYWLVRPVHTLGHASSEMYFCMYLYLLMAWFLKFILVLSFDERF